MTTIDRAQALKLIGDLALDRKERTIMTPQEHMQPLIDKVGRLASPEPAEELPDFNSMPYDIEPPIAAQAHAQSMVRQLKLDLDIYKRLVRDTESLLAQYEVMAGIPF